MGSAELRLRLGHRLPLLRRHKLAIRSSPQPVTPRNKLALRKVVTRRRSKVDMLLRRRKVPRPRVAMRSLKVDMLRPKVVTRRLRRKVVMPRRRAVTRRRPEELTRHRVPSPPA